MLRDDEDRVGLGGSGEGRPRHGRDRVQGYPRSGVDRYPRFLLSLAIRSGQRIFGTFTAPRNELPHLGIDTMEDSELG